MVWPFRDKRPLGVRGEEMAARYLRRRGYRILKSNARFSHKEIDLIARDGDTTVFVEVRTRASDDPTRPEDTVTPRKQHHLITAARMYLAERGNPDEYLRFDVIGIVMPEHGKPQITHYPDAFRP